MKFKKIRSIFDFLKKRESFSYWSSFFLCTLLFIFLGSPLKASEKTIVVTGEIQNLTPLSQIFIDNKGDQNFETIKNLKEFKLFGKDATGFKQSLKNTYWFSFSLRAETKLPLFLTVNSPSIDHVDLLKQERGQEVLIRDGDRVPWQKSSKV